MKLTKEQVDYIENRLIKNGVSYWDIRVEMLDHLASETEMQMQQGKAFGTAVNEAFFKTNLNGNLKEVVKSRLFKINDRVRKQYFTTALQVFTSYKTFIPLLLFVFGYYWLLQNTPYATFKKISLVIILTPVVLGIYYHILNLVGKNRSGIMLYASFYLFFAFLILQCFIQFTQPDGILEVTQHTHTLIIFIVVVANTIFSYAGIKVFLKNKKQSDLTYKKLQTL